MSPKLLDIIEEIKTLPPDELARVREAVEEQKRRAHEIERQHLVRSLRGKYRDSLSSTEKFLERKREEVELENRRFRDRGEE